MGRNPPNLGCSGSGDTQVGTGRLHKGKAKPIQVCLPALSAAALGLKGCWCLWDQRWGWALMGWGAELSVSQLSLNLLLCFPSFCTAQTRLLMPPPPSCLHSLTALPPWKTNPKQTRLGRWEQRRAAAVTAAVNQGLVKCDLSRWTVGFQCGEAGTRSPSSCTGSRWGRGCPV